MREPSRIDELYGADTRGRIRPPRPVRGWFMVALAVAALLFASWANRAELQRLFAWIAANARTSTYAGTVVDARSGQPLAGVHVHLASARIAVVGGRPWKQRVAKDAVTDKDGRWAIRTQWAGRPRVRFDRAGYASVVTNSLAAGDARTAMAATAPVAPALPAESTGTAAR